MNRYCFSPSALDRFTRYLESYQYFESDFNYSEETGYKASLEEIEEAREKELLDYLNKVPQVPSYEAARGTAFNDAVDMALSNGSISSGKSTCITFGAVYEMYCDGFTFKFDGALVSKVAAMLEESTMQLYVQATIQTELGEVLLHGYPDYIRPTTIADLKTTESYVFGKYANYSQRYAYPYIARASGIMQRVDWFEFLVVEMKKDRKTGIIYGEPYRETYTDVTMDKCTTELRWLIDGLITFVESHRDKITNPKIFRK